MQRHDKKNVDDCGIIIKSSILNGDPSTLHLAAQGSQHQAVKNIIYRAVAPAQMQAASGAIGDAPRVPPEPAPRSRRLAHKAAALHAGKTADVERNPLRICKRMVMRAIHAYALFAAGDIPSAAAAQNLLPA